MPGEGTTPFGFLWQDAHTHTHTPSGEGGRAWGERVWWPETVSRNGTRFSNVTAPPLDLDTKQAPWRRVLASSGLAGDG